MKMNEDWTTKSISELRKLLKDANISAYADKIILCEICNGCGTQESPNPLILQIICFKCDGSGRQGIINKDHLRNK